MEKRLHISAVHVKVHEQIVDFFERLGLADVCAGFQSRDLLSTANLVSNFSGSVQNLGRNLRHTSAYISKATHA